MKVGFIGLGRMGGAMARRLIDAKHDVGAYNRTAERLKPLTEHGAKPLDSIKAAANYGEAVFTMLADDAAVERVVFGEQGIASVLRKDAVHISSSTISTALARRLAAEHATRGQGYLSAPVFGRPEAAEGKKLLVVVAGKHGLVERCTPLFDAIGRQTFVIGAAPWQANALKLCGNFMIASMLEAFSEAFATLRKADVPPHAFLEIVSNLFGSPVYSNYGRLIADGKFEPVGFALHLGLKDVRLVLQTAEECAAPMPLASLIRDQFLSAMAHGQAEQDWASVAKVAARNAGL